jgi:hypothetical protein
MRGMCRWLLPLLALAAPATAAIAVRESQGRVDVSAAAAPLADVLDRLAKQTGMKIVYEGPAPRQLVTLSLVGRSPAEAVSSILEGQGLNYALILDRTATRVEKLLVTSTASSASGLSPAGHTPPSAIQPRYIPPEPEPEPEEPIEEAPPTPEPILPTPEALPAPAPGANPIAPIFPNAPALPPGTVGTAPVVPTPMSPLTPMPMPVVPVSPGPQPAPTPTPPAPPPP